MILEGRTKHRILRGIKRTTYTFALAAALFAASQTSIGDNGISKAEPEAVVENVQEAAYEGMQGVEEDYCTLTISPEKPYLIEAIHSNMGYEGMDLLIAKELIRRDNGLNTKLGYAEHSLRFDKQRFEESRMTLGLRDFAYRVPITSTDIYTYPTIGPELIENILAKNNSPAEGLSQHIFNGCVLYEIDPVIALAFFKLESTYGTKGVAKMSKNWGNVVGRGPAGRVGRYRKYNSWQEGLLDWCEHMKKTGPYFQKGRRTVERVLPVYAPSFENNTSKYISNMKATVVQWRKQQRRLWDE